MIEELIKAQLSEWDLARGNYEALAGVKVKELQVNNCLYKVQFNPARIISSAAKVDKQSLKQRKCFLCAENRPSQQRGVPAEGHYVILVNPFPIFPRHLTIPEDKHVPQRISSRFGDMLALAYQLKDYVLFYNGPKCGASAPDHAHFQAGNKGFLPLEQDWKQHKAECIVRINGSCMWQLDDAPRATFVIEAASSNLAERLFDAFYDEMPLKADDDEPMMNILAWYDENKWVVCLFPRAKHRPKCYTETGDKNMLISPASVDLGGVFIVPLEKDYEKITAKDIESILQEVCLSPEDMEIVKQKIKTRLL